MYPRFFRSLLLLLLLPSLSWAGSGPEHLKAFLKDLVTLQAKFEQSILDKTHSRAERFQGVFSLKRPGLFRWDYQEPYEQLIVADGDRIWVYDSDLEQVSNTDEADALKGTPAQLLSDTAPLEANFEVIDIGDSQGMNWVELIPRDEESQFIRILLAFVDTELRRMEMADQFGQVTRFQFYDIRRNTELDDKLFVFIPPKEFDILEQ